MKLRMDGAPEHLWPVREKQIPSLRCGMEMQKGYGMEMQKGCGMEMQKGCGMEMQKGCGMEMQKGYGMEMQVALRNGNTKCKQSQ